MIDDVYRFGPFWYSRASGLYHGSRRIFLSHRLEMILFALLEADGDVVDKQALHDLSAKNPRALRTTDVRMTQNISWLRMHLKDFDRSIIQTVVRGGYRIGTPIRKSAVGQAGGPDRPGKGASAAEGIMKNAATGGAEGGKDIDVERNHRAVTPALLATHAIAGIVRPADFSLQCVAELERKFPADLGALDLATLGWLKGALMGKLEEGLACIDSASPRNSPLPLACFYKAWLLLGMKRVVPALQEIDRGLSVSYAHDKLTFLKGWILCARREFHKVDVHVYRALATHPNSLLLNLLSVVQLGLQGDFRRAGRVVAETSRVHPNSTLVAATAAWLRAVQGHPAVAMGLLTGGGNYPSGYTSPIAIASVHRLLHDEATFAQYLKFATADQDPWRHLMWCDPRFQAKTV